jgi:hypothetical protein
MTPPLIPRRLPAHAEPSRAPALPRTTTTPPRTFDDDIAVLHPGGGVAPTVALDDEPPARHRSTQLRDVRQVSRDPHLLGAPAGYGEEVAEAPLFATVPHGQPCDLGLGQGREGIGSNRGRLQEDGRRVTERQLHVGQSAPPSQSALRWNKCFPSLPP